jgi:hypothetical protein
LVNRPAVEKAEQQSAKAMADEMRRIIANEPRDVWRPFVPLNRKLAPWPAFSARVALRRSEDRLPSVISEELAFLLY